MDEDHIRITEWSLNQLVEAGTFFGVWPKLPPDRHLCYVLAMLNGLRRNEIKRNDIDRLRWGQLHLDATIPFIDLKQKMGDGQDPIRLHPHVAKKKLMRHANEDVTDGYAHAELAEVLAALIRLRSPDALLQQAVKADTNNPPAAMSITCENADHQLDHGMTVDGHALASMGSRVKSVAVACQSSGFCYNHPRDTDLHVPAANGNHDSAQSPVRQGVRPSTQVD